MQNKNYNDDKSISQSKIKRWRYMSPKAWHKLFIELNNEDDDKDSSGFTFGSLLDTLLFTPKLMDERFHVADVSRLPSGAVKDICDCVFAHLKQRREGYLAIADEFPEAVEIELRIDFDKDLLLQCANDVVNDKGERGWNKGWKDDTRINKLIEVGREYFDLLVAAGGKKIITTTLNMLAVELRDILIADENVKDYFVQAEGEELIFQLEIFANYEYHIKNISLDDNDAIATEDIKEIPIKGALDIFRINHNKKTYRIVDFKTDQSAYNFTDSIRKYGYCDQLSFYSYLVKQWIATERPDLKDYTEEVPANIAIDTNDKYPYFYEHNWNDLDVARYGNAQLLYDTYKTKNHFLRIKKGWQEILETIAWHYVNNKWTAPKELLLTGKIKIEL